MAGFLHVEIEDGIGDLLDRIAEVVRPNLQWGVRASADSLSGHLQVATPIGRHFDFFGGEIPGGNLRRSLRFEVGELGAVLLGAEYGRMVITGTRPHPIRARRAPLLAFFWERMGLSFLAEKVNHPGTAPNDFRSKAIDAMFSSGDLERIMNAVLGSTLAGESLGA